MSRGAHTFKQGDVTKAIKGAVNASLAVERVEIQHGKIVIVTGRLDEKSQPDEWSDV
jgi:hypothetical protein